MAFIGIEGFDANRNAASGVFDNSAAVSFTDPGLFDGYSWNSTGTVNCDWNIGSNQDVVIQGAYYILVNTNSGFTVLDGTTIQAHLDTDYVNRRVNVYRATGTTNLLGSSANNSLPPTGNWFHLGWKVKIHDTLGTIDVWVDGVNVLSLTGLDTQASANAYATVVRMTVTQNNTVDHYFAFDGSGSANNSWPGTCRVYTGVPDVDNAVQFTRSAGANNWANVDELQLHDSDTTYNYSSTVGQKDLFDTTLVVPTGATVLCMESRSVFRKDDVGARTGRAIVKSGATTVNGTTINAGSAYVLSRIKMETDPDTALQFTVAGANAVLPGYEVMS